MCSRSICLACLAPFLGFVLASTVQAENLGWWKFDEGSGTTVNDFSGNGHDGTVQGTPEWGDGPLGFGGALGFIQTTGAYCDVFDPTGGTGTFTLTWWCLWDGTQSIQHFMTKSNGWGATTAMFQIEVKGGHSNPARVDRLHIAYQAAPQAVLNVIPKNEWAHVGLVFDGTNATSYVNGVDDVGPQPTGIGPNVDAPIIIGASHAAEGRTFQGSLDDMRLFDRVLTKDEIIAIMAGEGGEDLSAYAPDPADGSLHASTWANLTWRPGPSAVTHDVYLGDNYDDVNEGTPETFLGNQADTTLLIGFPGFPVPDGLVPGTTYYWRVDEVDDADPNSPWKGNVWSFSIPPKTAYAPDPADGAEFVDLNVELIWVGGYGAKLHTVYLGESFEEVDSAVGGIPVGTPRYDPGTLEGEKVLYWRVDEFDGVETHKGSVWSFTTPGAVGNPQP
ncbi:MAG: LamG domain-containing protein, partial [Planctomycetota bacterium]